MEALGMLIIKTGAGPSRPRYFNATEDERVNRIQGVED